MFRHSHLRKMFRHSHLRKVWPNQSFAHTSVLKKGVGKVIRKKVTWRRTWGLIRVNALIAALGKIVEKDLRDLTSFRGTGKCIPERNRFNARFACADLCAAIIWQNMPGGIFILYQNRSPRGITWWRNWKNSQKNAKGRTRPTYVSWNQRFRSDVIYYTKLVKKRQRCLMVAKRTKKIRRTRVWNFFICLRQHV